MNDAEFDDAPKQRSRLVTVARGVDIECGTPARHLVPNPILLTVRSPIVQVPAAAALISLLGVRRTLAGCVLPGWQTDRMDLPADSHVHSEWSWDTDLGAMDATCARAVALGLPAVAFTEHVDFTPFRAGDLAEKFGHLVTDGILTASELDVEGYLESVEKCRAKYPDLRILTGMEVGQPHRHAGEIADLLAQGTFDRMIGSLHCIPDGDEYAEPWELFPHYPADAAFRQYLAEIPRMVAESDVFDVLGHIDYPVRFWPEALGPFDPNVFEDELRHALRALAAGERALEINTRRPLDATILAWWREEGGQRVTFGSDAHLPEALGAGFAEAAAMAEAHGFRPDTKPENPWALTNKRRAGQPLLAVTIHDRSPGN